MCCWEFEVELPLKCSVDLSLTKIKWIVDAENELIKHWSSIYERLMKHLFMSKSIYVSFIFCRCPLSSWSTGIFAFSFARQLWGTSFSKLSTAAVWWRVGSLGRGLSSICSPLTNKRLTNVSTCAYYPVEFLIGVGCPRGPKKSLKYNKLCPNIAKWSRIASQPAITQVRKGLAVVSLFISPFRPSPAPAPPPQTLLAHRGSSGEGGSPAGRELRGREDE